DRSLRRADHGDVIRRNAALDQLRDLIGDAARVHARVRPPRTSLTDDVQSMGLERPEDSFVVVDAELWIVRLKPMLLDDFSVEVENISFRWTRIGRDIAPDAGDSGQRRGRFQ